MAALNGAATSAVVDKRIDGLLQHSLFVTNDDCWCLQVDKVLQPVVSVDNPSVQVVQVAGGESATVKLNHWVKLWRENRQNCQDHPLGLVAALSEGLNNTKSLDRLLAALARGVSNLILKLGSNCVEVHVLKNLKNGLSTHGCFENLAEFVTEFAESSLGQEVHNLDGLKVVDLLLYVRFNASFLLISQFSKFCRCAFALEFSNFSLLGLSSLGCLFFGFYKLGFGRLLLWLVDLRHFEGNSIGLCLGVEHCLHGYGKNRLNTTTRKRLF